MDKREKANNIYLMAIIFVGLIGLGIGSTLAMFNTLATIDNPITFNSSLTSTNLLTETIEVTVPAGEEKDVDVIISNTYSDSLNYAVWYTPSSNDLEVGSESSNNSYGPVGLLPSSGDFILTVELRNNSASSMAITIGVSSSGDNVVTPSGVTNVPSISLS